MTDAQIAQAVGPLAVAADALGIEIQGDESARRLARLIAEALGVTDPPTPPCRDEDEPKPSDTPESPTHREQDVWQPGMDLWPEWQDAIAGIEEAECRRAVIECLAGNWRKTIKKSFQAQVLDWLQTPAGERKYPTPLSRKQVQTWKQMRIRACLAARERIAQSTGVDASVPAYMVR